MYEPTSLQCQRNRISLLQTTLQQGYTQKMSRRVLHRVRHTEQTRRPRNCNGHSLINRNASRIIFNHLTDYFTKHLERSVTLFQRSSGRITHKQFRQRISAPRKHKTVLSKSWVGSRHFLCKYAFLSSHHCKTKKRLSSHHSRTKKRKCNANVTVFHEKRLHNTRASLL